GFSEKPDRDDYTYSQDERDEHLAAFIEALGAGPVILVGNSMGGLTSLSVAGTRPDLVARLVLMGSAGVPVPMSPQLGTIINYDFSVEGMEAIVEALTGPDFVAPAGMVTYRHQLSTDADTRRAYKAITGWNKARGGLHVDEALIRAIAVPTLVTGGKDDGVVPVSCAYKFLDLIEQSYGFIFPRCGHWPMIEFPAQFAQVVNDFIQMDALSA
ncbi:MAG: alpha/beta hydrolase, partial [Pseudomonadota bacterium]